MVNHGNDFGWLVVTVVRMLSCSLGSIARSKDSRLDILVTGWAQRQTHSTAHYYMHARTMAASRSRWRLSLSACESAGRGAGQYVRCARNIRTIRVSIGKFS